MFGEIVEVRRRLVRPWLRRVPITNNQIAKPILSAKFSGDVPAAPTVAHRRGIVDIMATLRQDWQATGTDVQRPHQESRGVVGLRSAMALQAALRLPHERRLLF